MYTTNLSQGDIIKMSKDDLENLVSLHGVTYVIDEDLGLWVKFEAKRVSPTEDRPHGVRYSLTLHNRSNKRIMGFDNSHAIEHGGKQNVAPGRVFDHYHRDEKDNGRPYHYENAEKLMVDFWKEVDRKVKELQGDTK